MFVYVMGGNENYVLALNKFRVITVAVLLVLRGVVDILIQKVKEGDK